MRQPLHGLSFILLGEVHGIQESQDSFVERASAGRVIVFKVPYRRTRLAMGIQASIMALGIVAMADDALAGPAGGYSVGAFDPGVNGANTDTGSCLFRAAPVLSPR